jgi:hypothetical protein
VRAARVFSDERKERRNETEERKKEKEEGKGGK